MTPEELECEAAYENFQQVRNFSKLIPNCKFDVDIELPPKPEDPKSIENYGLPKEQRKFPYYDIKAVKKLPKHKAKILRDLEWKRRISGFWWYNGDSLEYVVGFHYMFLQYWLVEGELDSIQPDFIDMQRDYCYALDWVDRNPNSFGLLFLGRRRTAKTELALNYGYWKVTSGKGRKFAIQSKTDDDAREVLSKVVSAWQKLPWIWRPTSNGATDFSKSIEFKQPRTSSTKKSQSEIEFVEVLNSQIKRFATNDIALDGQRFQVILNDEVFKTAKKHADISNRWDINRKCLQDKMSNRIGGKAIVTSTVEEVEKDGLVHMIEMWNNSQVSTTKENGRTISGLHALFFPAFYGLAGEYKGEQLVDEWGYSNMEASTAYLESERVGLTPEKLIGEKRKNPFDEDEAFYIDSKHEVFSQEALRSQMRYNDKNHVYTAELRRGNFYWKDGEKWGEVEWRDDPKGRWFRHIDSPDHNKNKSIMKGLHKLPTSNMFYTGCDPVDHTQVRDGKGSMPVGLTLAQPDPTRGIKRPTFACLYSYRHPDPNLFYEDMILQCVYYNSPFLAENQKHGVLNFFKDKGYDGYCMYDPTETDPKRRNKSKGLPTTGKEVREHLIRLGQSYVNSNVGYLQDTDEYGSLPFKELINDLLNFDPSNWTPHDYVVAFMVTLCAATSPKNVMASNSALRDFAAKFAARR